VRFVNSTFMGTKTLKSIVNFICTKLSAFWLKQEAVDRNRQLRKGLKNLDLKKKNSLSPSKDTTKVKN
jgi:hypothetical protein